MTDNQPKDTGPITRAKSAAPSPAPPPAGAPAAARASGRVPPADPVAARVTELFRKFEPTLAERVAGQIEAKLTEKLGKASGGAPDPGMGTRVSFLEEQLRGKSDEIEHLKKTAENLTAQVEQLNATIKLLEIEVAAAKAGGGGGDAIEQRFRTMTERMLVYLEKDLIPKALKKST